MGHFRHVGPPRSCGGHGQWRAKTNFNATPPSNGGDVPFQNVFFKLVERLGDPFHRWRTKQIVTGITIQLHHEKQIVHVAAERADCWLLIRRDRIETLKLTDNPLPQFLNAAGSRRRRILEIEGPPEKIWEDAGRGWDTSVDTPPRAELTDEFVESRRDRTLGVSFRPPPPLQGGAPRRVATTDGPALEAKLAAFQAAVGSAAQLRAAGQDAMLNFREIKRDIEHVHREGVQAERSRRDLLRRAAEADTKSADAARAIPGKKSELREVTDRIDKIQAEDRRKAKRYSKMMADFNRLESSDAAISGFQRRYPWVGIKRTQSEPDASGRYEIWWRIVSIDGMTMASYERNMQKILAEAMRLAGRQHRLKADISQLEFDRREWERKAAELRRSEQQKRTLLNKLRARIERLKSRLRESVDVLHGVRKNWGKLNGEVRELGILLDELDD